jgi:hypothetical protein
MNEQQFQSEMRRAETMRRLTSDPTEAEYLAGYIRGLRRGYHGEQFGTQAEHKLWMSLADDEASVRELTGAELARLASGRHVENLALTCEGDTGHGPCGTYLDWTDGTCARGHVIKIIVDEPRAARGRGYRAGLAFQCEEAKS